MELAVISDIHGNQPALEAVFRDMPSSVDEVVCLGDIVGYGPWPRECLQLVQDRCSIVLQGNHDREARDPTGYTENEQAMAGLWYTNEQLSPSDLETLQDLPRRQTAVDKRLLLVHDHPEEVDRYVSAHEFPTIRRYMDDFEACFFGHTHDQHEAVIDDRLILNPGSVGQPRDGDPRAAYAIVETETWESTFHRVEYDIGAVQDEIEVQGLSKGIADRLEDGY